MKHLIPHNVKTDDVSQLFVYELWSPCSQKNYTALLISVLTIEGNSVFYVKKKYHMLFVNKK